MNTLPSQYAALLEAARELGERQLAAIRAEGKRAIDAQKQQAIARIEAKATEHYEQALKDYEAALRRADEMGEIAGNESIKQRLRERAKKSYDSSITFVGSFTEQCKRLIQSV